MSGEDLHGGLGQYLALLGRGRWSTTEPYGPDDVGILPGGMPSGPDRCIVLVGYPNTASPGSSGSVEVVESVQIRVRGTTDESVARLMAAQLIDDLDGIGHLTLPNGVQVLNCVARQTNPTYQGADANGRHEYAFAVLVEYERTGRRALR